MKHFLFFVFLVWIIAPAPVEAHGYLVRSTPADRSVITRAPNQVQVWFSEGLEERFSTIEVFNQGGQQIDLGDGGVDERNPAKLVVTIPNDLPQGAYLVRMRPVFTSDGHAVSDTLVFWIGEQVGNFEVGGASDDAIPGEAAWRVVLTLALILLVGSYVMYAAVLRPAWGNEDYRLGHLPPRLMRRLSIMVWGALLVALITNILALLQITTTLFSTDIVTAIRDNLWEIVLVGSNFGDVWTIRMVLLVIMLGLQIIAAQQARNRPGSTHILWLVNGVFALVTLATLSLISHAAGSPLWPAGSVLVDYLHLLGVAVWIGGLIVLALLIRPALAPLSPQERGRALRAVMQRFSALALVSITVIVVTGIYATFTTVPEPQNLVDNNYGLTLLAKWVLILPLFALGALHHVTVSPERFQKVAVWLRTHQRFAHLPRTLRLEMIFAAVVILAAGTLPATPPPAPDNARGDVEIQSQTQMVDNFDLELAVNPGAIGSNSVDVALSQDGTPLEVHAVRVRFHYPARGRYTETLLLENTEPGLWIGATGDINLATEWDVYVDVVLAEDDIRPRRAAFSFDIVEEVEDESSRNPTLLNWLSVIGVVGIVGFWVMPTTYRTTRALDWNSFSVVVTILSVVFLVGITVVGAFFFAENSRRVDEQRNAPPDVVNPVFADQTSLESGWEAYQSQCLICHGPDGRGNMPASTNLTRPVLPFSEALAGEDDEAIYRTLANGIVNWHAYGTQLDDTTRWHLINLIRRLEF